MKTHQVTPENIFLTRRQVIKRAGTLLAGLLLSSACGASVTEQQDGTRLPGDYTRLTDEFGDPLTPLSKIRAYGNYYEFTRSKTGIGEAARNFAPASWQVSVGGLVRNPRTYDLDDLRLLGEEEYIYRMRCTEAWSMVIPWLGFPLRRLLEAAEPTSRAKYVRFESLYDPDEMPGQNKGAFSQWLQSAHGSGDGTATPKAQGNVMDDTVDTEDTADSPYKWPYAEGLRLDEAMHYLTTVATGLYGSPLAPENGAPVRLVVPWKYAFKSIKAIVKIELVEEMPLSFWVAAMPKEFGFYANVNPDVPHPRWSQSREYRFLGESPEPLLPTLPFNGYAEQVAHLYTGMDLKVNY